eukprot:SAG22_NODE_119_length_19257_cov_43.260413_24_plen_121_part_00
MSRTHSSAYTQDMEQSILEMLDSHMLFSDLEQVDRSYFELCQAHDDHKDLREYNFSTDGFQETCLVYLTQPRQGKAATGSEKVSDKEATALRRLAYRWRFICERYDGALVAPQFVQTRQR